MNVHNRYFLAAGALLTTALPTMAKGDRKPNIVFILADDLGYGDVGCYGQKYIQTPNIDQLASEGMMFTQAYAGAPVSAPSRASLMTGQHTGHTHVRGNMEFWYDVPQVYYNGHAEPSTVGQEPYDPDHAIIPEIMKKAGYSTGIFGKWAGGYEGSESTPDKRGVDEFYGYICQFQAHLYYPNFLNKYSKADGDTGVVRMVLQDNIQHADYGKGYYDRTQYSGDLIHQHALQWIGKQDAKKPFIAFLTYTLPHAELYQPQDSLVERYEKKFFVDKTWGGSRGSRYNPITHTHAQFAAMVTRLDEYVGQVVRLLKDKGLYDNTIIVFTSDNGPHSEGGADPQFFRSSGQLRGIKRECTEGGIREPFIVSWHGHISPSRSDELIAFYDILPTFAELAGVKLPAKDYQIDGISFAPLLEGKSEKQKKHDFLYWEFSETNQIGVRKGNWKLVVVDGVPHLYDLSIDIHEDNDLSKQHPEKLKELIDIVYAQHQDSEDYPVTLPKRD